MGPLLEKREKWRTPSCFSAEETDLGIPGDHRASHNHYNDHNSEFHIAPTPPSTSKAAGLRLRRFTGKTKGTKVGLLRTGVVVES